jgi:hypothetical protein
LINKSNLFNNFLDSRFEKTGLETRISRKGLSINELFEEKKIFFFLIYLFDNLGLGYGNYCCI